MKIDQKELKIAIMGSLITLVTVEQVLSGGVSLTTFVSTVGEHYSNTTLLLNFLINHNYIVVTNNLIQLTNKGRETGINLSKEFKKIS